MSLGAENGDVHRFQTTKSGPCDLEGVTQAIMVLTEKVDTLIQLNRDIIKWLLVVVCVIALGRSAFDVGKDLLGGKAHAAQHIIQGGEDAK